MGFCLEAEMPKFRALEIQGFRAFCRKVELSFDGDLAVLWGPNSQGKTSLCEGMEFLLTGTTVRRALTAGSQDEFAGALRNVHLPPGDDVFVQATLEADDGSRHVIKRVLARDFEKRSACESRLEIDGKASTQDALRRLGIVLSAPPMQAPILLQHTLAYLFSAKPGDRSAYFKALLEVTDLDATRGEIQEAIGAFASPTYALQPSLDRLKNIPSVLAVLKMHFKNQPDVGRVRIGLERAADALLRDAGDSSRGETRTALDDLRKTLDERQRSAFPSDLFRAPSISAASEIPTVTSAIDELRAADSALEKEIERFGTLYREVLRVYPAGHGHAPVDCPACGTSSALTNARLRELERRLRETDEYHRAVTGARGWLQKARRAVEAEIAAVQTIRPLPATKERRRKGFGTRELLAILGEEHRPTIDAWVKAVRRAGTARWRALRSLNGLRETLPEESALAGVKLDRFREELRSLETSRAAIVQALALVEVAVTALKEALSKVVSQKTSTVGWKDLLDLHADAANLSAHLIKKHTHEALVREHDRALKDFDTARDELLGDKFGALSDEMKKWWEFLRPESLATFESVGMRANTTRTVDFKVALYPDEHQKTKTLRDAIAVFSGSQLHCLGVAAFLARSVRDGSGFVLLDDPVLSSDHEHRSGFINRVIEELVSAKIQVILLTQEQRLRDDAGVRYEHLKPALFRIEMLVPGDGTVVTKTSDGISDKLARIKTLLSGSDEATRKQAAGELRDVAERFCKEVLVRHFGQPKTITDFDGQVLAGLIDTMENQKLFKAPDHKGKLALLKRWTNPGNHDAPVPATSELKSVFGDIKKLAKDYLA
jgi:hypothetical protein